MALLRGRDAWQTTVVLVAVGSTVALSTSWARADMIVTAGMQPWESCASCHSLDGISVMARFPKLAGQRPDYIAKQVRDFRDGRRRNDGGQMVATASDIGDDELAKTAAYFAGLPAPPPDSSLATETAEWRRGAALYRDGDTAAGIAPCSSCHDDAAADRSARPAPKGAARGLSGEAVA